MPPEKSIGGSNLEMIDTIGRWSEIGVSHILLDAVARGGFDGRLAALERFMAEVAPSLSS